MDSELFDMLSDTITIEPPDGTFTSRGKPNFDAAVSYPCRIQPWRGKGEHVLRSASGEERATAWYIIVGTTDQLNPESRITLPTGFNPQQPPFYSVGRVSDESGVSHMVLFV